MRVAAIWLAFGAALTSGAPAAGGGDEFPSKLIRIIVPYPAGGSTDIMARALQEPLGQLLGQPIVIENRAGAAGLIGVKDVAKSDPDGHTLLFANNGPISIVPLLAKDSGVDALKDFASVSLVSRAPLQLLVHPSVPADDVAGFIAYAKAQPQATLYASAGAGSLGHLSTERFADRTGIKLTHVSYRGQAPTTLAILTGEVKLLITTGSDLLNDYVKEGKIKVLGVSSPGPSVVAPGVEPIVKTVPGYIVDVWFGLLAPAATPPDVIAKLIGALKIVLAEPGLRSRFIGYGVEATWSRPAELDGIIAGEIPEWRRIIDERGMKQQ